MNILIDGPDLSDAQKDSVKKKIKDIYQIIEYPLLKYISMLLGIDIKKILKNKELLPQGGLAFKVDACEYVMGLDVCDQTHRFEYPMPEDHPLKTPITHYMGILQYYITHMGLQSILKYDFTSSEVKDKLEDAAIIFDETTSLFHMIDKEEKTYDNTPHRLGFKFILNGTV